jgi:hypothetical protein
MDKINIAGMMLLNELYEEKLNESEKHKIIINTDKRINDYSNQNQKSSQNNETEVMILKTKIEQQNLLLEKLKQDEKIHLLEIDNLKISNLPISHDYFKYTHSELVKSIYETSEESIIEDEESIKDDKQFLSDIIYNYDFNNHQEFYRTDFKNGNIKEPSNYKIKYFELKDQVRKKTHPVFNQLKIDLQDQINEVN